MFKWLFKKKGCAKHMNNKLEVIGIDHGWSMMKTISQVFVTGVKEITTTPALFGDVLEYEGKFYKVGTVRQEVKDTKVEDDSFYLLTLAAVAKELKRRGLAEAKVFLAVGLPLTLSSCFLPASAFPALFLMSYSTVFPGSGSIFMWRATPPAQIHTASDAAATIYLTTGVFFFFC